MKVRCRLKGKKEYDEFARILIQSIPERSQSARIGSMITHLYLILYLVLGTESLGTNFLAKK